MLLACVYFFLISIVKLDKTPTLTASRQLGKCFLRFNFHSKVQSYFGCFCQKRKILKHLLVKVTKSSKVGNFYPWPYGKVNEKIDNLWRLHQRKSSLFSCILNIHKRQPDEINIVDEQNIWLNLVINVN